MVVGIVKVEDVVCCVTITHIFRDGAGTSCRRLTLGASSLKLSKQHLARVRAEISPPARGEFPPVYEDIHTRKFATSRRGKIK
jgi:hypothetical protein